MSFTYVKLSMDGKNIEEKVDSEALSFKSAG